MQEVRPGDVVHIPAGAKHWHGTAQDAPMCHVAHQLMSDIAPEPADLTDEVLYGRAQER